MAVDTHACRACGFWLPFLLWSLFAVPVGAWLVMKTLQSSPGAKGFGPADALLQSAQFAGAFSQVEVTFDGQRAILDGVVESEEAKARAEELTRRQVRAPKWWMLGLGSKLNPVARVTNHLTVKPSLPLGWLSLSAKKSEIRLRGEMASEPSKIALLAAAASAFPGAKMVAEISVQPGQVREPADGLGLTASELSSLSEAVKGAGVFASAKIGQAWKETSLAGGRPESAKLAAELAVDPAKLESVAGDIRWLHTPDAIPPPPSSPPAAPPGGAGWISLSALGPKLRLAGAAPTEEAKAAIGQRVAAAFPNHQLSNEIRIDPGASSQTLVPEFPPLVPFGSTLPLQPEDTASGLFGVARLAGRWTGLDFWQADAPLAEAIKAGMTSDDGSSVAPEGVATSLALAEELRNLAPKPSKESPFLSIVAGEKRVLVVGEVAEPEAKDKLLRAARAKWPGREIVDEVQVLPGGLVPTAGLDVTLQQLDKLDAGPKALVAQTVLGQSLRAGVVHSVYFASGKAGWSKDQDRALGQIKRVLGIWSSARFEISGHSDNVGARPANLALSQKRAEQFLGWLAARGVDRAILSARGAGPDEPIAPNSSEAGRARNRRVDVSLKL